jgi:purine-binding chemotaxis protein CheW
MPAGQADAVAAGGLHVIFALGDTEYALPAVTVVQMETFTGATAVPGTPPWVLGLMQVRNRVLPVIDLRHRFGLPAATVTEGDLDPRVVVVARGDRVVALRVDRAREVLALPAGAVMPVPPALSSTSTGFVAGVARAGERLVLVLDLDSVLGQETLHGH